MDLQVAFNGGNQADLEMQKYPAGDDQKARASFYGAQLVAGQGRAGEPYRMLHRVYQVFFLNGVLFPGKSKLPRRYVMREEEEGDRLNGLEELVFYELAKLGGYVGRYLAGGLELGSLALELRWGIYLKYRGVRGMERMVEELARGEAGIMSAERVLERVSRDEEEWARALSRERGEMDYWSGLDAARERGERRGKLEAARKMKADGLSAEQIAKYSGLSRGDIEKL
jgi:predicted transposase/invertase (TIGR01784 family)